MLDFTFEVFPKIPRLKREVVITEKIDGTNAQICWIPLLTQEQVNYTHNDKDVIVIAQGPADGDAAMALKIGSRSRWIVPEVVRKGGPQDLNQAACLAGWPTPMAGTPAQKGYNEAGNTDYSRKVVDLCAWPTSTTRDHKDGASDGMAPINGLLGRTAWLSAEMGSGGQLNPEHSRWLMGYPAAWGSCGAMAMQSFLKPQRRSSKRT